MATIVDQAKSLARALEQAGRASRRIVNVTPGTPSPTASPAGVDAIDIRRREI